MKKIPEGSEHKNKNKICQLNRALYELKQAPLEWNKRFVTYLNEIGLEATKSE